MNEEATAKTKTKVGITVSVIICLSVGIKRVNGRMYAKGV